MNGHRTQHYDSPLGRLGAIATAAGVQLLHFDPQPLPADTAPATDPAADHLQQLGQELSAYFAGRLQRFTVPLAPQGSPFQQRVWGLLQQIPYGETRTYGELAGQLGQPGAARAVGLANGQNPLAILCPCHRVISPGGKLTGYAGGLHRKRALLELEGALPRGLF